MGVLLISEIKLKNFTNINRNVDMSVLKAEIQVCQDIDLQTLLGAKFYHHLLSQVTATGNTFNVYELELVNEFIQPWMIQQAYYTAIPQIHYRTMNRGIVEGDAENAKSVDIDTMKYLRSIQKERADFYRQRLMDYLLTGKGQNRFPDYLSYNLRDGMYPDKTISYRNPIVTNHTTRYGWALNRGSLNGHQMYSEIREENPPCQGCY
jgi:hypothetical protein